MVESNIKKIFLSASIPLCTRGKIYYDTMDIIAIRDSVIALARTVVPYAHLVWGGHPSITPLIEKVLDILSIRANEHLTLYQSEYFNKEYPEANDSFSNIIITKSCSDKKSSIDEMRRRMLTDNKFSAGVFIGGMNGVEEEFELFKEINKDALLFPIATTGAAAKIVYDKYKINFKLPESLNSDYAYMSLFRKLFEGEL